MTQPDGTTFTARLVGDEFAHVLLTLDGAAVVQDKDRWYCYAYFDEDDATCHSSGYRVGAATPGMILSAARQIPSEALRQKAGKTRAERSFYGSPVLLPATKAAVQKKILVLLVQFQDLHFTYTKADFERILNSEDFPSARKYLNEQFNGRYDFSFDVSDIVTVSKGYAYYGSNDSNGNDENALQMVYEAFRLAAASGIDFSQYAQPGSNDLDQVFVYFAGPDEADGASDDHLWSHSWSIYHYNLVLNGKRAGEYACAAETDFFYNNRLSGIGSFCHELIHTFNVPDLYDVDYTESGGRSNAMWYITSLMDCGNLNNQQDTPPYFNAIERHILGLSHEMPLTLGTHTLQPVHIQGDCYRLDTETEGEFFLFECRSNKDWDQYIGGSGLLIYHIDQSTVRCIEKAGSQTPWQLWARWTINICPDHQCAALVEATPGIHCFTPDGNALLDHPKNIFYPSAANNSFTPTTNPASLSWNGEPLPYSLIGIKQLPDGCVSFTVVSDLTIPKVSDVETTLFQDAAILSWSDGGEGFDGESLLQWGLSGKQMKQQTVQSYAPGRFAIVLDHLEPSTAYSANIRLTEYGVEGEMTDIKFMTKGVPTEGVPYIHLGSGQNADGTFPRGAKIPLRVVNATGASSVSWSLGGVILAPEGDGWYTLTGGGDLVARLTYPDGSVRILHKTIQVKP